MPWLLEKMGDRARLRACITTAAMFHTLCTEMALGNYDLVRYWNFVGDAPADIAAAYMALVDQALKQVSLSNSSPNTAGSRRYGNKYTKIMFRPTATRTLSTILA